MNATSELCIPDWRGETAIVLASGPSAQSPPPAFRDRVRVIAINEGWRLCPWADALYGCDAAWWALRAPPIDRFHGLRLTRDHRAAQDLGLGYVDCAPGRDGMIFDRRGVIGAGGNGGFQALNIAAQAVGRGGRVVLVGFDMNLDKGLHWHGAHPAGLNNPRPTTIARWRAVLDAAALSLVEAGVEVLNATPGSALTAYRRIDLEGALDGR